MARALRLEFAGALYHVTSRGDRGEDIYETDPDRLKFLDLLGEICDQHNWLCHAYCLMTNHYHLLIETPDGNLSKGMRQLNGVYSQAYNRANSRVGHVFQGRYKAILVEKEAYLLELSRYIVLNPVRARMVNSADQWPWSSHQAMLKKRSAPKWLHTDWILSMFGSRRFQAVAAYKKFIAEGRGQPSPFVDLQNPIILGSEKFAQELQELIDDQEALEEIPKSHRVIPPQSLDIIHSRFSERDDAIRYMYGSNHYTLKQIGDYFGLHYSRISRIVAKGKTRPRPLCAAPAPMRSAPMTF